jgi:RNA-directed DNA polymerase
MAGGVGIQRPQHTEGWQTLPWKQFRRNVYRLQQRIYQAMRRGDRKRVHSLQRLLLHSWSARCLAVKQVTQDNRGKRTPGVDGVASLTPRQRLMLAKRLRSLRSWTVDAVRRVNIPKPGKSEIRGLGIPTMRDRAMQALVKMTLEPEWEAQFEANSYGFRPGRSAHDAIEAIFNFIRLKPKYVLDADIEKCFDRINHDVLLKKLNTIEPITRLVRDWLKAGIMDGGQLLFPEAGTPQGGVISPLLANIALHGFEEALVDAGPQKHKPAVVRYADDFVVLHEDLKTLTKLKERAEVWLAEMGLQLKLSKTRISHTLNEWQGDVGFDFLGFNIRQHWVGKYHTRTFRGRPGFKTLVKPSRTSLKRHLHRMRCVIRQYRGAPQAALIAALNPIVRGWSLYYRSCVAKRDFSRLYHQVSHMLYQWATWRHSHKPPGWCYRRYWQRQRGRMDFTDGTSTLARHCDTPIIRHVKVRGDKSPYDGDWLYWGQRLGQDPTKPTRVTRLLKWQKSRCTHCGLRFMASDLLEVHHRDGNRTNNRYANLMLLHGHCHNQVHGKRCQ